MNICQRLPGIKEIGLVPSANLPNHVVMKAVAGEVIQIISSPDYISFVGTPVCEVEDKFDNNSHFQTAKLKFSTAEEIKESYKYAIIVETVNDEVYVMGEKENNTLVWSNGQSSGQPAGDPNDYSYEISFTAKKALLPCVLS